MQIEKKRKTCVYGAHWDSLGKEPGAGKINRPLCEHRETEIAGSGKASKGGDTRGGSVLMVAWAGTLTLQLEAVG